MEDRVVKNLSIYPILLCITLVVLFAIPGCGSEDLENIEATEEIAVPAPAEEAEVVVPPEESPIFVDIEDAEEVEEFVEPEPDTIVISQMGDSGEALPGVTISNESESDPDSEEVALQEEQNQAFEERQRAQIPRVVLKREGVSPKATKSFNSGFSWVNADKPKATPKPSPPKESKADIALRKAEDDAQKARAEADELRVKLEAEARAQQEAEEELRKAQEETEKARAEAEQLKKQAEADAVARQQKEELAKQAEMEAIKKQAEADAQARIAAEEALRKAQNDAEKARAEAEQIKKQAEADALARQQKEELAKQAEAQARKKQAEAEAQARVAAEEALRKARDDAEKARAEAEQIKKQAEADALARQQKEEEVLRVAREKENAKAARKKAEADALAREQEQRAKAEAEARKVEEALRDAVAAETTVPAPVEAKPAQTTPDGPPSGTMTSMKVTQDVTENGRRGIRLDLKSETLNLADQKVELAAYFFTNKSKELRDRDQQYRSSRGQVYVGKTQTVPTQSYEWTESLFLPYNQLDLESNGEYDLKVNVILWEYSAGKGKAISQSGMRKFHHTQGKTTAELRANLSGAWSNGYEILQTGDRVSIEGFSLPNRITEQEWIYNGEVLSGTITTRRTVPARTYIWNYTLHIADDGRSLTGTYRKADKKGRYPEASGEFTWERLPE